MPQEVTVTLLAPSQEPAPPRPPAPPRAGVIDLMLGIGTVLYVVAGSACAAFLLYNAYTAGAAGAVQTPPSKGAAASGLDDFAKLAIAALIGLLGTGLTGLAAIYGATRQANTANQVAAFNASVSEYLAGIANTANNALAQMKGKLDVSLAEFKAASDESLARLKVTLDANRIAHRELFGNVTVYFHTLRTIALTKWDEESLKAAQSAMVAATPHALDADKTMRDLWFDLWQRGEQIAREAAEHPVESERPKLIKQLFKQKVEGRSGKLDIRELHSLIEDVARAAIAKGPALP